MNIQIERRGGGETKVNMMITGENGMMTKDEEKIKKRR